MKEVFKPGQNLNKGPTTLIMDVELNSGQDSSESGECYYTIDAIVAHIIAKDNLTYMACKEC